jgi:hypothetical protein
VFVCPLSEREGALVRVRRSGGLGWDLTGRGGGWTPSGMALAVWLRWAARAARDVTTIRGSGAAPEGRGSWGEFLGEGAW